MILQALNRYYERKEHTRELAPFGFQPKPIPFVIVLSPTGEFAQLEDTRTDDGKRRVGKKFLVPQEKERPGSKSFEIANTLWDHYGYVLGHSKSESLKDMDMARKQCTSFLERCRDVLGSAPANVPLKAVVRFLESDDGRQKLFADPAWQDCAKIPGCNLTFRIAGQNELVCQGDVVRRFVEDELRRTAGSEDGEAALPVTEGICLVSGEYGMLARKHARTPIPDSKSNAKLVSFQKSSGYDSYGKLQSYNAPVGERAAFKYTTALNYLLRKGSPNLIQVGDASTVFWASEDSPFENSFAAMFGGGDKDDPDKGTRAVAGLYASIRNGVYVPNDGNARFHVLGLAPNAARIAVRFWQTGTVADFALRIRQHFDDIKLDRGDGQSDTLAINALLANAARETKDGKKPNVVYWHGKYYDVPPDLAGDAMRAILTGLLYPSALLQGAVRRCRAEQAVRDPKTNKQLPNLPHPRAAVIKASLNRMIRVGHFQARMLTMSLDRENEDVPYLLGRLFAVFEDLQKAAHKSDAGSELNRTIRESYYGSASSSPSSSFPMLVKLHQHHLSKLERSDKKGLAHYFRNLVGEICDALPPQKFPAHLSLPDQGLFAVGYYQQLHHRKDSSNAENDSTDSEGEN